jgi:hypothetical protein
LSLVLNTATVLRALVPRDVNGQCFLDRGTSQAGATNSEFISALVGLGKPTLRVPTTGHSNLVLSHPMDSQYHSYKQGDFTTQNPGGNLWDWRFVGRNGEFRSRGGLKSEITTPQAIVAMDALLGRTVLWHVFVDWRSAYSAGELDPDGLLGYQWYKDYDPALTDPDGNPIPPFSPQWLAMDSYAFKLNENKRYIKFLIEGGIAPERIIVNVGGEDWIGWDPGGAGPWGIDPGDHAVVKFTWIYQQTARMLTDLKAWTDARGWTALRYAVAFAESKEGGDNPPLELSPRTNDYLHFQFMVQYCATRTKYGVASMHYRGSWERFLSEDALILSFFTDGRLTWEGVQTQVGQGTLKELRSFIRDVARPTNPDFDLIPMANSVGDVEDIEVDPNKIDDIPGTPMTPFQRGLAAAQYLKEIMEAGMDFADNFPGVSYDHWKSGFTPEEGVMGTPKVGAHVFTKFPIYYPLAAVGALLDRTPSPDLMKVDVFVPGCPSFALRWLEGGSYVVGLFMINKTTPRVLPLTIGGPSRATIRAARRYSETELLMPSITPPVTSVAGVFNVTLAEMSVTYLEMVLTTKLDEAISRIEVRVPTPVKVVDLVGVERVSEVA